MPKLQRKNLSFQVGEISPRFYGRSDTEVYSKGLAIAENVIIDQRGGAFKRQGLEHFARINANNARLFTLQISRLRYYTICVFYDLLLDKGQMLIIAPGAALTGNNLLLNGNFAASGANWSPSVTPASSQVLFTPGVAILRPSTVDTQLVVNGNFNQQELAWVPQVSPGQSTVTFGVGFCTLLPNAVVSEFAGISQSMVGDVGESHSVTITGEFGGDTKLQIGTAVNDGTYLDTIINSASSGQRIPFVIAASPFTITLNCIALDGVYATLDTVSVEQAVLKTSQISQQATVVVPITESHLVVVGQSGSERIHVNIGTTEGGSDILSVDSTDHEVVADFVPNNATYWVSVLADGDETAEARIIFVGTAAEAETDPLGVLMDAPWTEAQLDELHVVQVPSGKTQYFTHPNVPVQRLFYDHGNDVFSPLIAVSFINPPPQWTGTNFPATGTHFQGRLWLGGTPGEPQTIWGSKSATPEDFTVTEGEDDSSLEFTLQEFGRIEWMLGTKNLLIGAENGEHIVTSDGGVITPSDFKIEQQSSYGSNNMQAVQVGEKVFYLTPDGRKLRAMAYEWQENNWLSQDLTFVSEHITAGIGIHSAWSQNPGSLYLVILRDGTMASLTYDRTAETVAWTRIITPGQLLKDIASGRRDGTNEVVSVGQRLAGTLDIETNRVTNQKLDSFVSEFNPAGTNVITGLDHLEGLEVRPIVDGAVNPLVVVVGGQITTEQTGIQLYAGIPYTAKIVTLPPDVPQDQIRSWKKRWNKVWALMFNSKPPIINGTRPPDRTPSTPMNTPEPNTSTHYKTVNLGWDDFGQVTIEEDLPVNMNVLAIYGEMRAEEVD